MEVNFYDGLDQFCDRIREATEIIGNPNAASKKVGVTPSSINRWIKGESDPSRTNLIRIAEAAGVNVAWLATGEGAKFKGEAAPSSERIYKEKTQESRPGEPQAIYDTLGNAVNIDDFIFVPRYNVKAAAGNGHYNSDHTSTLRMAFRRFWVDNYLHVSHKDLSVIGVKGDSMEGILNDGDNILINHADKRPGNGLYVMRIGEDLIVKHVQSMPGGKLLVTSSNDMYEPFEIDLKKQDYDDIEVIGKVVWFGRQI